MDIVFYIGLAVVFGGWLLLEVLFIHVSSNALEYIGEKWSDFYESRRKRKDVSIERQ